MKKGQKPTDRGIVWGRVPRDMFDYLFLVAVEASKDPCQGKTPIEDMWGVTRFLDHSRTHHYTARDGSERCAYNSVYALHQQYRLGHLKNCVPTSLKAQFAEHVQEVRV